MAEMIASIKEWQELIGALIGATAALGVAMLVSYSARRREDLSAGMVLVGNLTTLIAAENSLQRIAKEQNVAESEYPFFVSSRLTHSRPTLSPLFESCVARVMPVNVHLASHLELLGVIYRGVEHHLDRMVKDIEYHNQHGKVLRSETDVRADADLIANGFSMVAKHADCAERLLTHLVLSNWPTWNRLRMIVQPLKAERDCKSLLIKVPSNPPPQPTPASGRG